MPGIFQLTPAVRQILILVAIGWLWTALVPVRELLALDPTLVRSGEVWRLLTYPFAGNLNLFTLIGAFCFTLFAIQVEADFGTGRFQRFFWSTTVLAGALATFSGAPLFSLAVPMSAFLTVFCLSHAEATIYAGLPPLVFPLKAKYLLLMEVLLTVALPRPFWLPGLGAMLFGYLVLKRHWLASPSRFKSTPTSAKRKTRIQEDFSGPKVTPIRPTFQDNAPSLLEAEVDRILDKLRLEGMAALTAEERETLDRNSRRLRHGDEHG